jgi:hypothetical protein
MTSAIIAAASAVFVAVIGATAAYSNNKILQRRDERLRRLNAQLSELYGPLVMIGAANRIAFLEFERRYAPEGERLFDKSTTNEIFRLWRIWVETVFLPNNKRIVDILQAKAHLLVEDEVPPVLLQLAAHTYGYEALLARWQEDDFSDYVSIVDFPRDFQEYIQSRFHVLKTQQLKLLRNDNPIPLGHLGRDRESWDRYSEYGYWGSRSTNAKNRVDT